MTARRSPGIAWLAARTGKTPEELLASPLPGVQRALVELAKVAARAGSEDPDERAAAEVELASLREEIEAAPRPSDGFLSTVAGVLRDSAERLRRDPT